MYEITSAITLFVVVHIATIYVCAYVLRLEYAAFIAATAATGAIAAVIAKVLMAAWQPRIKAGLDAENRKGELGRDVGIAVVVFLIGATVSNTILYKKFGLGGWLGVLGANMLVNAAL
jgi:hypothetical protein